MKIVLISYGDLRFDGRLRSLLSVFSQIGDLSSFTKGEKDQNQSRIICNSNYFRFIVEAVKFSNSKEKVDLLVLDNRKATIPGLLIRLFQHPKVIIQDCRELYLSREVTKIVSKIGCVFEKRMARRADIVTCANEYRADILQKEYGLTKKPLVYENLRQLQFESEEKRRKAAEKLDKYFEQDEIRIISTSGCSVKRTNDVLVENIEKVKKKCKLFLVGDSTPEDEKIIKEIINRNDSKRVVIVGRLNQTELKYLISMCHIGIVNYGQYDTNNKYCASGKLFEFLYEGLPVVTTSNPPLKKICDEEEIGVADDQYCTAINLISEKYGYYKEKVNNYIEEHTVQANDELFASEIRSRVKEFV